MWIAVRIGVLYGTPIVAVGAAILYFGVLLLCVRRGAIDARKAALRYACTLVLPLVVILIVWGAGEMSSYLAAPGDYHWDAELSRSFLLSLLPLGAYVGAPIAALVVTFWVAMKSYRQR
jgi:hypothetical protein